MRRLPTLLLIFVVLLGFPNIVLAEPEQINSNFYPGTSYRFDKLSIDDGLSQNAGLALLQDRQGYLWIGTQDGLNRYSGIGLTQYKNDPDDPASLSHNSIISLYEDHEGVLWVGTWGGGLNRFNAQTSQFDRFVPDENNPDAILHGIVTSIVEDQQKRLWIGTLAGLELFDRKTEKFTHFRSDPENRDTLSSNAISVILPAADGNLWVGTGSFTSEGKGINRINPATGKVERLQNESSCLDGANVSSILELSDGSLWIGYGGYGVSGGGLVHFDPKTKICQKYLNENQRGQLVDNNVTDLLVDQDNTLWVTMWNSGLFFRDLDSSGKFQNIHHDPGDSDSLSSDNTYSLLLDRSNVLWVGTLSSGINKLNLQSLQFRTYRNMGDDIYSIRSNHIGAFSETSDGTVWVGTWDSGLAKFNPINGTFMHYQYDANNESSISSNLVMSLFTDQENQLWIGTLGGGLNLFNQKTNNFIRFQHYEDDPTTLLDDQVTSITQDQAGRLWITTMSGLSRKDPLQDTFVNYPITEQGLAAPLVSIFMDGTDLWTGSWGGGLYRLDLSDAKNLNPETAVWENIRKDSKNEKSLSDDSIWVIHKSMDGLFWLGTQGGLNRYNPDTGEFKHFTEKNGFRNSTILGIMEDETGFLWITTNNGLVKFDRETETALVFDKTDGLQGNEFNSNSYYASKISGDFYIGGTQGFTAFNPLEITKNEVPPNIVITDFRVFNESLPYDASSTDPIELTYRQNFLSFEFVALDFHSPKMNQYAYQLENFDPDWVMAGNRNYASYTNLPGGDYIFKVKAANNSGVWNDTGIAIPLKIIPPFWKTGQFWIVVLLFLSIIGFFLVSLRTKEIQNQKRKLEEEVFQRTSELKLAQLELKRRAEKDLSVSEARFQTMFEHSPVGMGILSLDRKIIDSNPAMCTMLGYTREELIGQSPALSTFPEDFVDSSIRHKQLLAGEINHYIDERRYIRKNGEVFWALVSMSMVRDTNGEPIYMVGVISDIDKQKKSAENLRESEARFRAMFENSGIGITLVGLDRKVLAVNDSLARIAGRTREELLNTNGALISHPDDVNIGAENYSKLVSGELNSYQVERRYIRKDNKPYWVKQTISAVHDPEGKIMYLVVMVEDIDSQKNDQENLRKSEARFKAMFDNTSVGVAIMSLQRRVLDINHAAEMIIGRTKEELKDLDPAELSHPDDVAVGHQEFVEMISGKRSGFSMEKRYILKNNQFIWARVTYSSVLDGNGVPQYLIGIIEDITEEKLAREKLARQEADYRQMLENRITERTEELNKANELLQKKAAQEAVVAERTRLARDLHDAVTQTLFSATLIADVLPDIWDMNKNEGYKRLEELRQLTRGALAEMRTLLVELRPNALVDVALPVLLRQLTEAMIGRARIKISLNIEGEQKLPPEVQISIYRVTQEALNNIGKHAKASQALVNLQLGEKVRLSIEDDGQGFEPNSVTADHLGLKIMRERAEAVGAKFSVYSEPGEGTQITFTWQPENQ
ncbi:MAG: PAS domain S-box protein [Anaerolineaceae bacterium]